MIETPRERERRIETPRERESHWEAVHNQRRENSSTCTISLHRATERRDIRERQIGSRVATREKDREMIETPRERERRIETPRERESLRSCTQSESRLARERERERIKTPRGERTESRRESTSSRENGNQRWESQRREPKKESDFHWKP